MSTPEPERPLNSMKPIWTRPQSEVSQEDYKEFYRHISHDWTEPLKVIPYKAEGRIEYQALLFVPSHAPHDLFTRDFKRGVQLYVNRLFIMYDCEAQIPRYMRFVKGVVDAADMSLNVSREILQQDRQVTAIRRRLSCRGRRSTRAARRSSRRSLRRTQRRRRPPIAPFARMTRRPSSSATTSTGSSAPAPACAIRSTGSTAAAHCRWAGVAVRRLRRHVEAGVRVREQFTRVDRLGAQHGGGHSGSHGDVPLRRRAADHRADSGNPSGPS